MEITNIIFEKLLINNNVSKKEFSEYSKIPYDTVAGWKKRNHVPPYAIVILKDMNYRKKLDLETSNDLRRNVTTPSKNNYSLSKNEEKRLKSIFLGTNYTTNDIVKGIQKKNQKIIKRFEENLPFTMQRQIVSKLANA
jgi:hypothetical protein